jgi:hypothetical protein
MLNGGLFSSCRTEQNRTEHDTNKQTTTTFLTVHTLPIQAHRRSFHLVDGLFVFSSFRFQTLFLKNYDRYVDTSS